MANTLNILKKCSANILTYSRCSISTKQIIYNSYGNPEEVLQLITKDFDENNLQARQVLVKWLASPINPADINQIQGVYPIKPSLPAVAGNEGCAEVIKVGSKVETLTSTLVTPGEIVIPKKAGIGTWCTFGVYECNQLHAPFHLGDLPSDLTGISMLNVNASTAYRLLKDFEDLEKGDCIVQNGANSAVGQFVIQLCRIWGLKSVNVVRNRDGIVELKKYLEELGADDVFTEEEFAADLSNIKKLKIKLALNCVGGRSSLQLARVLDFSGSMVSYGGMAQSPVQVATSSLIFQDVKLCGFWMSDWYKGMHKSLACDRMHVQLIDWFKTGELKVPKNKKYRFDDYKEALREHLNPSPSAFRYKQILTAEGI